jgi:hypothetical protein
MKSTKRLAGIAVAGAIAAAGVVLPAHAGFIATMQQVGGNVVVTGTGSFDTAGLIPGSPAAPSSTAVIDPSTNVVLLGGGGTNNLFTGLTHGSATFGSGGLTNASSTSGAVLGIGFSAGFAPNTLYLPNGYVSGTSVSDTTRFSGATFTSLGVTPGTYVWSWGSAANGDFDTFTLQIGSPVPEPASALLFGLPVVATLLARRSATRERSIATP